MAESSIQELRASLAEAEAALRAGRDEVEAAALTLDLSRIRHCAARPYELALLEAAIYLRSLELHRGIWTATLTWLEAMCDDPRVYEALREWTGFLSGRLRGTTTRRVDAY